MQTKIQKIANQLAINPTQLTKDVEHYNQTGQILNRPVALVLGLTQD